MSPHDDMIGMTVVSQMLLVPVAALFVVAAAAAALGVVALRGSRS